MITLPKKIEPNKYDPMLVTIAIGQTKSTRFHLGSKSVMGMYVIGYEGLIYFNGSMTEDGINLTGDPSAPVSEYSYAYILKPDDVDGNTYTVTASTSFSLISVDYTVLATPNWVELELESAATEVVSIFVQPYDI